jgi:hypothetical protein
LNSILCHLHSKFTKLKKKGGRASMSSSSDDCNEIVSKFCSKITVSLPKGTSDQERHSKKTKQSTSDNLYGSPTPLNKELECQLGQLQKNLKEFVAYTENLEKRLKAEQNKNYDLCGQLQTAEKENKILSKQLRDSYAKGKTSTARQAQQQETWELHNDAKAVEGASKVSRAEMTHQAHDQPELHRPGSNLGGLYSTLRKLNMLTADIINALGLSAAINFCFKYST